MRPRHEVFKGERFEVKSGGRQPVTWAHWQIGLAYAKYLRPEFPNVVQRGGTGA